MIVNFRRIQGATIDGRHIKDKMLYRSGNLTTYTQEDIRMMRECHIKHIIDLRSDEECAVHPYRLPDDFNVHHVSALKTKGGLENFYFLMLLDKDSTAEEIQAAASYVREGYRILPMHNPALKRILSIMTQEEGAILFHCSSGKDRTGVLAALLQKLLGIKDDEIMKEYLISNDYIHEETLHFADEIGFQGSQRDTLMYVCHVHPELLQSSFAEVEKYYPDYTLFFQKEYGLDTDKIARLKERYLE